MLIIQKFGGSSLVDAEKIRHAADIIADEKASGSRVVSVLSACGKTTDRLISQALALDSNPDRRELDQLLSTGEISSAALMAIELKRRGHDCVSLSGRQAGISTNSEYGDADIRDIDTRRICRELDSGRIVIVAGFQGTDIYGNTTTLGRGGSDTTAVALAAALDADRCEIYSDVDGIYTADPRLIPDAKRLDFIDYESMLLLSRGGSQVLHSKSVETAMRNNVTVHLLSSISRSCGTVMNGSCRKHKIAGITRDKQTGTVSIVGGAADIRLLEELCRILSDNGIPVLASCLHDGKISLVTDKSALLSAMRIIHSHIFSA